MEIKLPYQIVFMAYTFVMLFFKLFFDLLPYITPTINVNEIPYTNFLNFYIIEIVFYLDRIILLFFFLFILFEGVINDFQITQKKDLVQYVIEIWVWMIIGVIVFHLFMSTILVILGQQEINYLTLDYDTIVFYGFEFASYGFIEYIIVVAWEGSYFVLWDALTAGIVIGLHYLNKIHMPPDTQPQYLTIKGESFISAKHNFDNRLKLMGLGTLWYLFLGLIFYLTIGWEFLRITDSYHNLIDLAMDYIIIFVFLFILVVWPIYTQIIPSFETENYLGIRNEIKTGLIKWIIMWVGTIVFPTIIIIFTYVGLRIDNLFFYSLLYSPIFNLSSRYFLAQFLSFILNLISLLYITLLLAIIYLFLRLVYLMETVSPDNAQTPDVLE